MEKSDHKRHVDSLRSLAVKQRELNDAQIQARRAAWDQVLANASSQEDVEFLARELAVNPVAW